MILELLTAGFSIVHSLDVYESLIWTDRYNSFGDFELVLPTTDELLLYLASTAYMRVEESEHLMVLEDVELSTDAEEGDRLVVTGRSLESILDRRIVWEPTILQGYLHDELKQLLEDNAISPSDNARDIPGLTFVNSTDVRVTGLGVSTQVSGQYIYSVIAGICKFMSIGFKLTLDASGNFNFEFYSGTDRSYEQSLEDFVVFSYELGNLNEATYVSSTRYEKTIVLVAGEQGVGSEKETTTVEIGSAPTGLQRKEMYIEPNVQRNVGGSTLSDEDYILQLKGRGLEALAENRVVSSFDGEVEPLAYQLGVDYFMGDIVQVEDDYGNSNRYRITEITYSNDAEGMKIYPTFSSVEPVDVLIGEPVISGIPIISAPTLTEN